MRKIADFIGNKRKEDIIASEEERFRLQLDCVVREFEKQNLHLILLAGPSGSGKTTTAKRIKEIFNSHGRNACVLSMDNWYKTRTDGNMPLDEKGNIDYESPESIDLSLLNKDIKSILQGKKVKIPHFDFVTQEMVYNGTEVQLKKKTDILIIEGIHALNPAIEVADGIRVYINPEDIELPDGGILTGSRIRLFRRVVRDAVYRGMTPEQTIAKLESVTRGERLYIEPNKDNIDVSIDSLIGYELLIRDKDLDVFTEIYKILDYAYRLDICEITSKDIPEGSILEEFYK